jgi:hypothetical protein
MRGMDTKHVALYARVSTRDKDQDPEFHLRPLLEFAEANHRRVVEYVDWASGADLNRRDAWKRLEAAIDHGQVACVVTWKLDRAFRSTLDALTCLQDWTRRGVHFRCLIQADVDLSSPASVHDLGSGRGDGTITHIGSRSRGNGAGSPQRSRDRSSVFESPAERADAVDAVAKPVAGRSNQSARGGRTTRSRPIHYWPTPRNRLVAVRVSCWMPRTYSEVAPSGARQKDVRRWRARRLGSNPVRVILEAGHLSVVVGYELRDGRRLVVESG